MSNAPWMSRWQRSPRQDRRVVENGKFVELGKVQIPEPPAEEVPVREESALEIVQEAPNVPEQEQSASGLALHDAVAAHEKGSQTIAEIAEALAPLPGDILTEEQSDALAETLRLPEPVDDEEK